LLLHGNPLVFSAEHNCSEELRRLTASGVSTLRALDQRGAKVQNEKKADPADTAILLAMARRKLCQDAIDNDQMEPPFAILTIDRYGNIASEHSITVDAEGEFTETEIRGSADGRMNQPFDMKLTDTKKEAKERQLNFI
jgi:hypothetical protein